jgi:hypothetical protein
MPDPLATLKTCPMAVKPRIHLCSNLDWLLFTMPRTYTNYLRAPGANNQVVVHTLVSVGHPTAANNLIASRLHQFHTPDQPLFVMPRAQGTNSREMHTTNPVVHALVSVGHPTAANNLITSRLHQFHTLDQPLFVTPRAQETNPWEMHTTNPDVVSMGHQTTTNNLVTSRLRHCHTLDRLLFVTPRAQETNPREMHVTDLHLVHALVSVGHPTTASKLVTPLLRQSHNLDQLLVTCRAQETNPQAMYMANPDVVPTPVSMDSTTTTASNLVTPLLHQSHDLDLLLLVTPRVHERNPRAMPATNPDIVRALVSVLQPVITGSLITLRPRGKLLFVSHRIHDSSPQ